MRIEHSLVSELSDSRRQTINSRVEREFGNVPIVREHVWAEPRWAFMGFVDDELVSFLNVVDRNAIADDTAVHLLGLNNVITEPQHRGKGYSTLLNRKVIDFMIRTDPDAIGLLFCADDLISFYQRLGWTLFKGEVIVSQPAGDKRWTSNAMLYDRLGCQNWKAVHLCGLPW